MKWTTKQQAAIFGRAKKLLISAAAGSGKTAVLVERVFARLNDRNAPADITEFLIVTFTNAAAAEMRARLCKRISEALQTDPQNRHLRRQMQLVHNAHITTVHAFCLSLIRDHFHTLNLRPDFRLPGENEAELLLDEAAEEILTEEHDGRTPAFEALLAALADEKSDARFKEHLKRAHIWFQSEPDGEGYVARCNAESQAAVSADPAETVWGRRHLRTIAQTAAYCLARYDRMLELTSRAEGNTEKVRATLEAEQSAIAAIAQNAADGAWMQTARAVEAYCGQSTTLRFPKAFALDLAEAIKTMRNEIKKKWKDHLQTDIICEPIADTQAAFAEADVLQREFFRLVVRLDERFTQRKREANLLDFADLEHLAVRLLAQKGDDGEFRPTPLALEKSAAFREIMVDEYQDTNGLQDLIFRMLSAKSSLFTVGDVKQSIYLFRRADPGIFLRRKNTYQPAPDVADEQAFAFPAEETAISLSDNFRSRKEVLDSVNFVFSALCSEEFGGLVYDDGEALHCGRSDEPDARYVTELDVLDLPQGSSDGEDEEEDALHAFSAAEIEAAHIARRIRTMLDEHFPVADKNGMRPCRCGDFAILLRSPKNRAAGLSRALRARGIAVAADKNENFFASDEVNALLALLHTVDNPGSDLDLIGCLASPLVGFSYDELAQIRASNRRQGLFYDSLCAASVGETPLAQKAADFLAWLTRMRHEIADRSAAEAVSYLLDETAAVAVYTAAVGGEARRENLLRILSLAQGYDKIGGFGEFVRYLDRLEEADNLARPNTVDKTDSVKIMSIHASKGLEFPVVFLAGLSDKINVQWKSEALALHPTLGPGFKNRSRISGGEMTTLRREAIVEEQFSEQLSEELRILYVAMTRAREKLICVARHKDAAEVLRPLEDGVPPHLPVYCRLNASFAAWMEAIVVPTEPAEFRLNRVAPVFDELHTPEAPPLPPPDMATCEAIRARLAFADPHKQAAELPAKLTATLYKRMLAQEEEAHALAEVPRKQSFAKPKFTEAHRTLSPTERGTATHLAMQLLPLRAYANEAEIADEIVVLARKGQISAVQAAAITPKSLLGFYQTALGRTIAVTPAERVKREFKFSLLVPSEKYFPDAAGETLLLQGVADLFYETETGEVVIVDFKTDNVTPATSPLRAQSYAPQLAIYADALAEITGKPVGKKYLYFFATGELIEV